MLGLKPELMMAGQSAEVVVFSFRKLNDLMK